MNKDIANLASFSKMREETTDDTVINAQIDKDERYQAKLEFPELVEFGDTTHKFLREIIPSSYQGQRIDKVLASMFQDYSRSKLKEWLLDGTIKVNNKIIAPSTIINGDEEILFTEPNSESATNLIAQDIKLDIVFADEHLIIVNKQPGLIVHPGAGNPDNTLVNALLHFDANLHQLPRAGIIHRLDKDTSGLLVIARNLKAHNLLTQQMQMREISRHYLALVYGHIIAGDTIETGYGRDPRNRLKMAVCNSEREAVTKYTVNKQYQFATLLNVELLTGRTHQIRVHMTHIKHPIIGDQLYRNRFSLGKNVPEVIRNEINSFSRQALHACKLTLTHPETNETITFNAKIPDDLQNLLNLMDEEYAKPNS
jgi:23S rRNA pseudouridine1911/1915/1917 synthase